MNEKEVSTSSPHRHSIPDYLRFDNKVKNIRGKTLTNNDKRRIIREIYKKINIKDYENDVERREAIKYEYKMYKDKLRNDIVLKENELGFAINGIRKRNIDGTYVKNESVESEKDFFNKNLYSANGQHILFTDTSHIDTEETQYKEKKETRRSKVKNKLSSLMRRKKTNENTAQE